MIAVFNIKKQRKSYSFNLSKIVSIIEEDEEFQFITTLDMDNGVSFQIVHNVEDLGCEMVNAIVRGTIEGTIYADECPDVIRIRKYTTKPE
jgi:hypothetical protein